MQFLPLRMRTPVSRFQQRGFRNQTVVASGGDVDLRCSEGGNGSSLAWPMETKFSSTLTPPWATSAPFTKLSPSFSKSRCVGSVHFLPASAAASAAASVTRILCFLHVLAISCNGCSVPLPALHSYPPSANQRLFLMLTRVRPSRNVDTRAL